ncbi:MAG: D-alanyl-D-alanine carboxypeptidase [Lachnospiraceae bacterium]|nr:D-alanyl-D-alanine carboxypeptidase [Lachnospiraceae bacterium]
MRQLYRETTKKASLHPITLLFLLFGCFLFLCLPLKAQATAQDYLDEAEERKNDPVESNETERWPQGPAIGAASAILMDADSGTVLYAKNIHEHLFPASTTKLLTCLVAVENCSLGEIITINQSAIDANESDGSHMYLEAGEQLTLEELLYGILINSANEACNAVGEHIAGSMDAYVDMMNARAAELGCTDTHFVTTNGLHDDDHYTSAHDLALIARAFFSHEVLCTMSNTPRYSIKADATHGEHNLRSKNKLYEGQEYAYDGLVGSKTGFTSKSRQTLVSCAERGGMRLICVIMMEESPFQFSDTAELFDYGFAHFGKTSADELQDRFRISNSDFFSSAGDIFGSTQSLLRVESGAMVILPDTLSLSDLETKIVYDGLPEDQVARIDYSWKGITLGSAPVLYNEDAFISGVRFTGRPLADDPSGEGKTYVNIYSVLKILIGIGVAVVVLVIVIRLSRIALAYRRKVARIKKRRGEIVKSRATLRKSFHRHSPTSKKTQQRPRKQLHLGDYGKMDR